MQRTPTQLLADHLLDEPVEDWLRREQLNGLTARTTRDLAALLAEKTNGAVSVSHATIATWLKDTA